MKRYLSLFLALLLTLSFAACDKTQPTNARQEPTAPKQTAKPTQPTDPTEPTQVHVHTPGEWNISLDFHMQFCTDCGERLLREPHAEGDPNYCSICTAEFLRIEGYGTEISVENEHGHLRMLVTYDVNNALMSTYTYEYTYNTDGNMLTCVEYTDGKISLEEAFSLAADGAWYTASSVRYFADGSTLTVEYNENQEIISQILRDADGNIVENTDQPDAAI